MIMLLAFPKMKRFMRFHRELSSECAKYGFTIAPENYPTIRENPRTFLLYACDGESEKVASEMGLRGTLSVEAIEQKKVEYNEDASEVDSHKSK